MEVGEFDMTFNCVQFNNYMAITRQTNIQRNKIQELAFCTLTQQFKRAIFKQNLKITNNLKFNVNRIYTTEDINTGKR